MDFGKLVVDGFNALTPEIDSIYADAIRYTRSDWMALQKTLVASSGAAAVAIPVAHVAAIGADVAFLMNRMSVCSYGIGAIIGNSASHGNILEDEDFAFVLAKWSGVEGTSNAAMAKTAADLVAVAGSHTARQSLAKTMCKNCGIIVGKKMGSKVGVKLGAKFGTKLGGKLAAGFIPFLGMAVGAGINYWFIDEISGLAEEWYSIKAGL